MEAFAFFLFFVAAVCVIVAIITSGQVKKLKLEAWHLRNQLDIARAHLNQAQQALHLEGSQRVAAQRDVYAARSQSEVAHREWQSAAARAVAADQRASDAHRVALTATQQAAHAAQEASEASQRAKVAQQETSAVKAMAYREATDLSKQVEKAGKQAGKEIDKASKSVEDAQKRGQQVADRYIGDVVKRAESEMNSSNFETQRTRVDKVISFCSAKGFPTTDERNVEISKLLKGAFEEAIRKGGRSRGAAAHQGADPGGGAR